MEGHDAFRLWQYYRLVAKRGAWEAVDIVHRTGNKAGHECLGALGKMRRHCERYRVWLSPENFSEPVASFVQMLWVANVMSITELPGTTSEPCTIVGIGRRATHTLTVAYKPSATSQAPPDMVKLYVCKPMAVLALSLANFKSASVRYWIAAVDNDEAAAERVATSLLAATKVLDHICDLLLVKNSKHSEDL